MILAPISNEEINKAKEVQKKEEQKVYFNVIVIFASSMEQL